MDEGQARLAKGAANQKNASYIKHAKTIDCKWQAQRISARIHIASHVDLL
jgi:hypothetical protein